MADAFTLMQCLQKFNHYITFNLGDLEYYCLLIIWNFICFNHHYIFRIFIFSGNAKGWFMYMATWTVIKPNETARLLSPVFKPTNYQYCEMRFHYHMFGDDKDILSIKLRTSADPNAPMQTLWAKTGKCGSSAWFFYILYLSKSLLEKLTKLKHKVM